MGRQKSGQEKLGLLHEYCFSGDSRQIYFDDF